MFSCASCGQEWKKHPATVVPCPDCHAGVGLVCVRPSGHTVPLGEIHVRREQAAVDAGLLLRCTAVNVPPELAEPVAGTQFQLF